MLAVAYGRRDQRHSETPPGGLSREKHVVGERSMKRKDGADWNVPGQPPRAMPSPRIPSMRRPLKWTHAIAAKEARNELESGRLRIRSGRSLKVDEPCCDEKDALSTQPAHRRSSCSVCKTLRKPGFLPRRSSLRSKNTLGARIRRAPEKVRTTKKTSGMPARA